ncbi:MAG: helix-hairpin-helix domain-containing protein [Chitinophagaceae bacterium]|nr:MAG: helix-hairpin-helix domain-containing protein [Chitinophagaceae bacterium]
MPAKRLLREYFLFSRNDRIAVITLLLLIGLAWSLPYLFAPPSAPFTSQDSGWVRIVDEMTKPVDGGPYRSGGNLARQSNNKTQGDNDYNTGTAKRFTFDPNTLGPEGWRELGVRDRTIETILKYRSKGGYFRQPGDLGKVYGLQPGLVEELLPFVRIGKRPGQMTFTGKPGYSGNGGGRREYTDTSRSSGTRNFLSGRPVGEKPAGKDGTGIARTAYRKKQYEVVDLNLADTTALIALPCIGSKLAHRMIQFRDKLGGFHSVEQVREIYGITDSAFEALRPWLKADAERCRMIAINQVTLDELKVHPYVRFELARTIIAYRQEHGVFQALTDLQKITALTSAAYEKIRPYLRL